MMKPLNVASGSPDTTAEKAKGNSNAAASQQFKALLLFLMVVQNSSTVLVGRHTRSSGAKEDLYSVNHLIMTCELLKVSASLRRSFHSYPSTRGSLFISFFKIRRSYFTVRSIVLSGIQSDKRTANEFHPDSCPGSSQGCAQDYGPSFVIPSSEYFALCGIVQLDCSTFPGYIPSKISHHSHCECDHVATEIFLSTVGMPRLYQFGCGNRCFG